MKKLYLHLSIVYLLARIKPKTFVRYLNDYLITFNKLFGKERNNG